MITVELTLILFVTPQTQATVLTISIQPNSDYYPHLGRENEIFLLHLSILYLYEFQFIFLIMYSVWNMILSQLKIYFFLLWNWNLH